ncbi:NADPH oxidoreductase [Pseudonocardia eucalypti]|uniref:NADPH oxidoreductase n=1 Tax=Pseudonocardia eucalypti TaxID=648755 RepID=A0ABP9PMF9_9PSEU|nr:ferredoxin-NADP reductase [Pseudonocardia eucalypti]
MLRLLTTPLLPEDFTELVSPLWSRSAPRGRVVAVRRETERATTLRIRPGRGWSARGAGHRAGQFLRLGVDVDGVRHWRSYSLTSVPGSADLEVTVQAQPDGVVSPKLAHGTEVGDLLYLADPPAGEFVLPDPVPAKLLMITAGSGITPVMAMLRTLAAGGAGGLGRAPSLAPDGNTARGRMPDTVLLHSAPRTADVVFHDELRALAAAHPELRVEIRQTALDGRLDLAELDQHCPDWADRAAFVCGPAALRDAARAHWSDAPDRLRTEGFTPPPRVAGTGGRVRFASDRGPGTSTQCAENADSGEVEVGPAASLLEAGERAGFAMPSGCRMGICFGCLVPLRAGQVRDLRSGQVHGEPGDLIQTCINGAAGPAELGI